MLITLKKEKGKNSKDKISKPLQIRSFMLSTSENLVE